MGYLYEVTSFSGWGIWLFIVFALMAFNEFARSTRWGGLSLFLILPIVLTIFIWPETAAAGNEYGTGTWFNWVKTYSALAGCLGFMAIRYIPGLAEKNGLLPFLLLYWLLIFLRPVYEISKCIVTESGREEWLNIFG